MDPRPDPFLHVRLIANVVCLDNSALAPLVFISYRRNDSQQAALGL